MRAAIVIGFVLLGCLGMLIGFGVGTQILQLG
jgi:hypothetical protein